MLDWHINPVRALCSFAGEQKNILPQHTPHHTHWGRKKSFKTYIITCSPILTFICRRTAPARNKVKRLNATPRIRNIGYVHALYKMYVSRLSPRRPQLACILLRGTTRHLDAVGMLISCQPSCDSAAAEGTAYKRYVAVVVVQCQTHKMCKTTTRKRNAWHIYYAVFYSIYIIYICVVCLFWCCVVFAGV